MGNRRKHLDNFKTVNTFTNTYLPTYFCRNLNISRWLEAYSQQNADLTTLPGNAILTDVLGDGNYNLVITDIKFNGRNRSKMKIYKGTLVIDLSLPDIPNSLISFYTDQLEPKIPAVAVACGSDLLIHKNNKPYYKFQVPQSSMSSLEIECWKNISEGANSIKDEQIEKLKKDLETVPYDKLSNRSQEILTMQKSEIAEMVYNCSSKDFFKESPITCMTTLRKNSNDEHEVSCPVLATESGNIYILDPQAFTIVHQANTNTTKVTPFSMKSTGIFNVEFRIFVACREGHICVLRRGWLEGKSIIHMTTNIVDFVVVPEELFVVVATTDKLISCFTKRGSKLWSITIIDHITCMCLAPLYHIRINLVAVGLKNGSIHFFHGRKFVDQTSVTDAPSVITFGQLGQEENVLVVITMAGTVIFKILKRTADFNLNTVENVPLFQSKPLPLPKRSKLFLEQSIRERSAALEIHQTFQQDLIRMRLNAARELLQQHTYQSDIVNQKEQIKLSAQVLGLGTKFTVIFTLENMEANTAVTGISMILHVKPSNYDCTPNNITIPLLQPNFSYKMKVDVEEKSSGNQLTVVQSTESSIIRVFIMRKFQSQPILAATINMPLSNVPVI
ncbi:Bardet-Biedl syndrome 1 isoform X1 [Leptinotarsa decemlineata]|uniref:Bardet-Biedl syndrome 1 isoform X1 n=2 Tax=Leptinotarsa decemlineata TaxID=7539 RepID=UPI003D30A93C